MAIKSNLTNNLLMKYVRMHRNLKCIYFDFEALNDGNVCIMFGCIDFYFWCFCLFWMWIHENNLLIHIKLLLCLQYFRVQRMQRRNNGINTHNNNDEENIQKQRTSQVTLNFRMAFIEITIPIAMENGYITNRRSKMQALAHY